MADALSASSATPVSVSNSHSSKETAERSSLKGRTAIEPGLKQTRQRANTATLQPCYLTTRFHWSPGNRGLVRQLRPDSLAT
jgi:hypothetical protein